MRLALLMNFVAPQRVQLLEHLRDAIGQLRVLASTTMESDRHWELDRGTLDVVIQRNITLRRKLHDRAGFAKQLFIHLPYDTIPQLLVWRPDAVITVELGARSVQAVLFTWLLRPSVPLLVWCMLSEHTERNWGGLRQRIRRFILSRADVVFVNGESGARYIARFGVPQARIVRLNQPVDVARFISTPHVARNNTIIRLLYVGILDDRKRVVALACSLADWGRRHPERTVEITWLGDGAKRAELEAIAWPANLRPTFCGNLPYSDVPTVYACHDILVFPTLADEWGLVVNEAMASGLPVLGSIYSQAVEELVVEDETGWVFDPLCEAEVMSALDRALNTAPDRLKAMGELARRRMAALTPQATADHIATAVRATLAVRPSRSASPNSRA